MSYSDPMEKFLKKGKRAGMIGLNRDEPPIEEKPKASHSSPIPHQTLDGLKEPRVICWMCRSWSKERYMVNAMFEGAEEKICLNCAQSLGARDMQMESLYNIMHPEEDEENESKDTGQDSDQS